MLRSGLRYAIAIICFLGVCALLCSCGAKNKEGKVDAWKLVSTSSNEEYGTYLGNGFISTRIMGDGIGNHNGMPLDCYMADLYIKEKLTAMPTWSDVRIYDGVSQFKLDQNAPYKQTLDMKTGILSTEGSWTSTNKTLKGSIKTIISRDKPGIALIKMDMESDFDGQIKIQHTITNKSGFKQVQIRNLDPSISGSAWELSGTTSMKYISCATYVSVNNQDLPYSSSQVKSADGSSSVTVNVKRGAEVNAGLWVSWSRSGSNQGAFDKSRDELKKTLAVEKPVSESETAFLSSQQISWAKLWEKDITISGDPKAQQAIHSFMFYLFQSVREGSDCSIPPMGLSNNSFNGHIFWDADTWMFPALLLQHPELARSIVEYRFKTLNGARQNASKSGMKGAQYAWESGETGIEDAPKGIEYVNERHIGSDVALAQWQYYLAIADKVWLKSRGYPVISATADYWAGKVKSVNGRYEIQGVVPPDENAGLVNNSVYTNAGAKLNLLIAIKAAKTLGISPNPEWQKVADALYIPFDKTNQRYIARDAYTDQKLKQADPELVIYPLQYFVPGSDEKTISKNTYDFYTPKVMPNGPAMSSSVHSLLAARLGNAEESIAKLKASYTPFIRGSFNYFNEKRSKTYKNACFLTGAAGPLQAIIFGIAGTRMEYLAKDADQRSLTFAPCMPKNWKSIELKGICWQGKVFNIKIDSSGKALIFK